MTTDGSGQAPSEASEEVRLEVPASTAHLRLVRLMVTGLANEHGADLDDLDDLRLAVGEICAHLIHRAEPGDVLVVRVIAADATVRVEVTTSGGTKSADASGSHDLASIPEGSAPRAVDELVGALLSTVTDRFGVTESGVPRGWFERSLRGADASS